MKELEEKGIGRPSTYAPILSTIQERGYVEKDEARLTPPSSGDGERPAGQAVPGHLRRRRSPPQMEETLDEIEEGERAVGGDGPRVLRPVREGPEGGRASRWPPTSRRASPTGETCPKCGEGQILERWGRFGRFLACERYPDCKYSRNVGDSVRRRSPSRPGWTARTAAGRWSSRTAGTAGSSACSGYPECKNIKKPSASASAAPRRAAAGSCRNGGPSAGGRSSGAPTTPAAPSSSGTGRSKTPCPKCGMPFLTERAGRGKQWLACGARGADYRRTSRSREAGRALAVPGRGRPPLGLQAEASGLPATERGASPPHDPELPGDLHDCVDFLGRAGSGRSLDADARVVRGYLADLHERGLARTSIARRLATLRSFFRYLIRRGRVTGATRPARSARRACPGGSRRICRSTRASALFREPPGDEAADRRDRAVLEVLYATGVRVAELAGARRGGRWIWRGQRARPGEGTEGADRPPRVARRSTPLRAYLGGREGSRGPVFRNARGGRLTVRSLHRIVRRAGAGGGRSPDASRHTRCATPSRPISWMPARISG